MIRRVLVVMAFSPLVTVPVAAAGEMVVANNLLVLETEDVKGHVPAARNPLAPEMVTIPGTDYEINGPTYSYQIGKYEITAAEYAVFLNDAQMTQQTDPNDPRCTHMWIDTNGAAAGDVYMQDVTVFPPGSEWHDRALYKASDFRSLVKYDAGLPYGARYYVATGSDLHPIVTVSWYGSVKFCNWLTMDAGMDAAQRCYHEGPEQDDWYPVTAAHFSTNGLLASERLELVRDYRGYRLPMDGANGGGLWNNDANPYNEWYKAAAFDPAAPDTVRAGPGSGELVQPDHWIFGYGDDVNTNAFANLNNSGDPFEFTSGHAPVGWYNGINLLTDGTPTRDTHNRYGLYDMSGNVAEWGTDKSAGAPTFRSTRSGRHTVTDPMWATAGAKLFTTGRLAAQNNLGLRVARSPGYGDFDGDGDMDLDDLGFFVDAMTGPVATITPGFGHEACDYDGDGHVDLRDFGQLQAVMPSAP